MTHWYYSENGQQRGPIGLDELKRKIAAGELSATALVWRTGTVNWSEVRNFPELLGSLQSPPPLPSREAKDGNSTATIFAIVDSIPAIGVGSLSLAVAVWIAFALSDGSSLGISVGVLIGLGVTTWLVYLLRPRASVVSLSNCWRRFFAKLFDVQLVTSLGLLIGILSRPSSTAIFFLIVIVCSIATWTAFEVILKGKSPGRYLFAVRLSARDNRIRNEEYLVRFIRVALLGMGALIPLVSTVANALAYKRLREKGTTLWDDGRFLVACGQGIGRPLAGLLAFFVLAELQLSLLKATAQRATGDEVSVSIAAVHPQVGTSSQTDKSLTQTQGSAVGNAARQSNARPLDNLPQASTVSEAGKAKTSINNPAQTWSNPSTKRRLALPAGWTVDYQIDTNLTIGTAFKSASSGEEVYLSYFKLNKPIVFDRTIMFPKHVVITEVVPDIPPKDRIQDPQFDTSESGDEIASAEYTVERDRHPEWSMHGHIIGTNNYWVISTRSSHSHFLSADVCVLVKEIIETYTGKVDRKFTDKVTAKPCPLGG